jgi:hypothetical protein
MTILARTFAATAALLLSTTCVIAAVGPIHTPAAIVHIA